MKDEVWYCQISVQKILQLSSKKLNPNENNSEHSNFDPDLKNPLYQLNNFSQKETTDI